MIRKYHNHKLQTTPWHREEDPLNHHETPGRQIKQSNQLSLPHQNLAEALSWFKEHGLKLKPKKCLFFQREVDFLCQRVSSNCIAMSDLDIKTVKNWPSPKCS